MLSDSLPLHSLKSDETLKQGIELPELNYLLNVSHVFMFSAVTWNRHLIHYSNVRAKAEGHKNIVVQRGLLGNIYTRYINELFSDHFISQLDWRVNSSAYPDDQIYCKGVVLELRNDGETMTLKLKLQLSRENVALSEAEAVIRTIRQADVTQLYDWNKPNQ